MPTRNNPFPRDVNLSLPLDNKVRGVCRFPPINFSRKDASGETFESLDLRNVRFERSILQDTKFIKCHLSAVSFEGADLTRATFSECFIGETSFKKATLEDTSFYNCHASYGAVYFDEATLKRSVFTHCDLRKSSFLATVITDCEFNSNDMEACYFIGTIFENTSFLNCVLSSSRFFFVNDLLEKIRKFTGSTLASVRSDNARFCEIVDMVYSDGLKTYPRSIDYFDNLSTIAHVKGYDDSDVQFWIDKFGILELDAAIEHIETRQEKNTMSYYLSLATLGISLEKYPLIDVQCTMTRGIIVEIQNVKKFNRPRWIGVTLKGAVLTKVEFKDAELTNCAFEDIDLTEASFKKAKISGCSFAGSCLKAANFAGALIKGTYMADCSLQSAKLDNAFIERSTFERADLSAASLKKAQFFLTKKTGANILNADLTGSNFLQKRI